MLAPATPAANDDAAGADVDQVGTSWKLEDVDPSWPAFRDLDPLHITIITPLFWRSSMENGHLQQGKRGEGNQGPKR